MHLNFGRHCAPSLGNIYVPLNSGMMCPYPQCRIFTGYVPLNSERIVPPSPMGDSLEDVFPSIL